MDRRQRRNDLLLNAYHLITAPIYSSISRGYELLRKNKKRTLAVFFFVLEAISVLLDQLGKSKWGCLLAALLLSAFSFLITLSPHVKGATIAATKSEAEKQLLVVEIFFSFVQLIATSLHFTMTVLGVKKNYNASIFPLAFAITAMVFVFRNDRLQNIEVHMLQSGDQTSIDLTTVNCYEELYKKVAEKFNTKEESKWIFFYVDQFYNVKMLGEPWEQFCMAVRTIAIYQTEVINGQLDMRNNENLSPESEENYQEVGDLEDAAVNEEE